MRMVKETVFGFKDLANRRVSSTIFLSSLSPPIMKLAVISILFSLRTEIALLDMSALIFLL